MFDSVAKEEKTFQEKIEAMELERLDCIEGQVIAHTKNGGSLIEISKKETKITGFMHQFLPVNTLTLVSIRKIDTQNNAVLLLLDSVIRQAWEVA